MVTKKKIEKDSKSKTSTKKEKPKSIIYKKRTAAKLTQQQLADMVGVQHAFMNGLENGKHNISFTKGIELCKVLNIDPEELYKFLKRRPS